MEDKEYVASLVARSREALKVAENLDQRKVDEIAAAIVYTLSRPDLAKSIAEQALAESGMGRVDSKTAKMTEKLPCILYDILPIKTCGIIEEIPEKGLVKYGKPLGVIAALIPATNPEATPAFKGILALRGRNTVIFSPSRRTYGTSKRVIDIMREILKKNGLPEDIFICMENAGSSERARELMAQCDITMATGSGTMVKAAYSSGKPAYGVGAGNAVVVIDETADIDDACAKIAMSKQNDWASGCSAENSIVVQDSIYDKVIEKLCSLGGYLVDEGQKQQLERTMWPDGHHINREIVARPAERIAELAGFPLPEGTRFILVEESNYGKDYNFSHEKLSVVLTVYRYHSFDEAIEKVNGIQRFSGLGHSCGIYSFNEDHIDALAKKTYTAKVIVRQPHSMANSGAWNNGLAKTFSLGCGTWGGNIVSENITQKHYINTTWVSRETKTSRPPEEMIYRDLLQNVVL